ncbi:MAG: M28 family peptidase, partial [Ignavibacteriaceae bacterium]|nr:M28 family peptidase [Ignavibacteriaceae bacterium]
ARLLKTYSPDNYYSVEFVWFNGEEFGLWGSKNYMRMHKDDSIAAMINMDMIGTPTGFNVMGFDDFVPFFEKLKSELAGFNLTDGVKSKPGTNSDHMSFMFAGIPTFEIESHLDENMYQFYHERGDTFDKVNIKYLSDASAVAAITLKVLANASGLNYARRSEKEMVRLFKQYGLDKRLKRQGEWIYKEE